MSKRRHAGEWVRLGPYTGFVGESDRLPAEIQPEQARYWAPCLRDCGDDDCQEWTSLWTAPDPENAGKRWSLCHVSECEMFDVEVPR